MDDFKKCSGGKILVMAEMNLNCDGGWYPFTDSDTVRIQRDVYFTSGNMQEK